jgi:dual specificity protein kinase YAK1
MWSLGCIAFELIAGLPLFPGCAEYDQLRMLIKAIGYVLNNDRMPPDEMLARANEKKVKTWFKRDENGKYKLKTVEELEKEGLKNKIKVRKMCYKIQTLDDVALVIPCLHDEYQGKVKKANTKGLCFVHFLKGILKWEPEERYSPSMALQHPFITGLEWSPEFTPTPDEVKETEKKQQQYVNSKITHIEILPRVMPNKIR